MINPGNTELILKWLDRSFDSVSFFEELLEPKISGNQKITPIKSGQKTEPIGDSFIIKAA